MFTCNEVEMIASDANSNNINKSSESSQLSNFEENRCEQNQAASSDEKIEEVEAEESDEEEADDSGEIEDSPKIQESQPSLTPTPPTPTDEQFSRKSTESKATASRGPALSAIENDEEDTEEEEIEFNRTVKVYDQFNPELEYLSDPDYHDDRPTKKKRVKGIKSDKSEYNTGDEEYKTSDEELEVETNGFLHDQEAAPLSIHFELGLESPERSSPIAIPEAETSGDERLTVIAKSDSEEESRGIIGELDDQQVAPDEVETAADDTSSSETLELDNQGLTGVSEGNSKVECELSGSDSSEEVSPSSLQVYQSEVFNCVISETNNNQEDQTATELPVTASEAQAELFVDESTLADSNLVDLKSKSSTDFLRVEDQDNNPEEEDSLNETRADELITDEPTPVPDQDQQIGSHLKGRQQSLEDVDATVLDQVDAECVEKIEEDDEEKRKRMLIELIENYCESLVEMIKDEALKQIELISKTSENVNNLILSNAFEIVSDYSSNMNVQIDSNSQRTTSTSKKVYTSSMYYNDNQNSFPTIGQQVERCRTIAKQLEEGLSEAEEQGQDEPVLNANDEFKSLSPLIEPVKANLSIVEKLDNRLTINNDSSRVGKSRRASQMFKLRRERMNDFTLDNSVDSDMDNDDSVREKPTSVSSKLKNRLQKSATLANCSRVIVGVNSRRQSVDFYGPTTDGEADPNYDTSIYYEEKGTEDLAAVTDTEYEAPKVRRRALPTRATTTPFSERRRRHVEVNNEANESRAKKTSGQDKPKYKPFLDSSTLKDIEKLRAWSPYGEFNEHNSVSPEVCSKLVQDMRSSCDGGQVHINGTNKGAKLFSRRQLQSSDWIVTSDDSNNQVEQEAECKISLNGTRLDSSTEDDSNCRNESISESEIDDSKLSVDRRHLSRPSLSEETTLIVDANDDYCASVPVTCELASVVSQPELELATITKTPSFSTSSWRVIESDSPDLLGHQEDQVKEEYAATIRVEGDEVDTDSNEASESDLVSQKSELTESKATSLNLLEVGEEAVVAAKARPLSRTGELHQATLLEWRPHVAPPTWMSTTGAHIKSSSQSSSLLNEAHASSSRKRCTSLTHDIEPSSSTTAATTKTVGEVQEQRASVASLRDSYQTLIEDELAGNKYRSYHHRPFGQQAASSLNDRDEYFSTPPLSLSPQPPMVEQPPDQLSSDLRPQQQGRRKGSQQPPGWFPSWRPDQLARYHSVPPELRPTARRDVYLSASPIGPEPAAGQANELGLCTCHAPCRVHHSSTSIINSGKCEEHRSLALFRLRKSFNTAAAWPSQFNSVFCSLSPPVQL